MPIAAGGDAFGDVVAAWGTPEILGRLEAMRMLLMQADRRVVSTAYLYAFDAPPPTCGKNQKYHEQLTTMHSSYGSCIIFAGGHDAHVGAVLMSHAIITRHAGVCARLSDSATGCGAS